jgi:hypothetical protein
VVLSPIACIEPGREFCPVDAPPDCRISPVSSHQFITRPEMEVRTQFTGSMTLALCPVGRDATIWPKVLSETGTNTGKDVKYVCLCVQRRGTMD